MPPNAQAATAAGATEVRSTLSLAADEVYQERWYSTLGQIAVPFLLASIGVVTAGLVMGHVEDWRVYREMNELFVLVPALCGLKGNLDMCVASRFSTQSNIGNLQDCKVIRQLVIGNLALVQVQAIVCSMLLVVFTVCVSSIIAQQPEFKNFSILAAAALVTSTTSCLVLDSILMLVILFSQRYRFNPDYMATPIVASIGDVISISLLSFTAAQLHDLDRSYLWISIVIMCLYLLLLLPLWVILVLKNLYTRKVLAYGWIPVIGALCISQVGGFVLSSSVTQFPSFAVYSPIINGIGGNLVCVQASNMGSLLYQSSKPGTMPEGSFAHTYLHFYTGQCIISLQCRFSLHQLHIR
ncbi:solute carrier family 41 member 3 [Drosophila busckii]|uniref:solute carrier family 41 member 3 n=1 Tax=Drosophila busckii TaxID=30019 RepID=UPI00083EC3F2|nr:solute carrier family 41 member 3 [Drosophila busckii]